MFVFNNIRCLKTPPDRTGRERQRIGIVLKQDCLKWNANILCRLALADGHGKETLSSPFLRNLGLKP